MVDPHFASLLPDHLRVEQPKPKHIQPKEKGAESGFDKELHTIWGMVNDAVDKVDQSAKIKEGVEDLKKKEVEAHRAEIRARQFQAGYRVINQGMEL